MSTARIRLIFRICVVVLIIGMFAIRGFYLTETAWENSVAFYGPRSEDKEIYMVIERICIFILFLYVSVILASRFLFDKLPPPERLFNTIGSTKSLRVLLVLGLSSLLAFAENEVIYHLKLCVPLKYALYTEIGVGTYIGLVLEALILTAGASFFFEDMTKKDIAKSAIVASGYYLVFHLLGLNNIHILSFTTYFSDIASMLFIKPWAYPSTNVTHAILAMLFPFIYVLLARSKSTVNSNSIPVMRGI